MERLRASAVSLMTISCVLIACTGGSDRKGEGTAVMRAPVPTQVSESVSEDLDSSFRYDPAGKPDPFKSFVRTEMTARSGVVSPLERFDLSQIEVTGIIWNAERPRALVQDPTGKGYVVGEGASMGKNQGRVVRIDDNRVVVKETYVDFRDQASSKEVELHLYERHGG